jgi:hypothetical protein
MLCLSGNTEATEFNQQEPKCVLSSEQQQCLVFFLSFFPSHFHCHKTGKERIYVVKECMFFDTTVLANIKHDKELLTFVELGRRLQRVERWELMHSRLHLSASLWFLDAANSLASSISWAVTFELSINSC